MRWSNSRSRLPTRPHKQNATKMAAPASAFYLEDGEDDSLDSGERFHDHCVPRRAIRRVQA